MKSIHLIGVLAITGAALAVSSCSTGGRSPSGFLGNYSQLDAGYGTEDAVSTYVKPGVDLKQYDSVLMDPVTTVIATQGINPEVTSQLAAYVSDSLRGQLTGNLKIVGSPGPTTLRVRTALTDVIENQRAGAPVTTVHTNPRVALSGKLGSETVAAFISNVSFEGEILDSTTGERLCALVDHRLGKKRGATASTSWAAVRSGVNQGAGRLVKRLMMARAR